MRSMFEIILREKISHKYIFFLIKYCVCEKIKKLI